MDKTKIITDEVKSIDKHINKKYNKLQADIKLYEFLLEDSNNSFYIITKNLITI